MHEMKGKMSNIAKPKVRPSYLFFLKNVVNMEKRRIYIFSKKDFSTFQNVSFVENFFDFPLDTVDNWDFFQISEKGIHISHI